MEKNNTVRLTLDKVSKTYNTHSDPIMALKEISFTAEQNEFICIIGPSGCGKTTLLKIIDQLIPPTSGLVEAVAVDDGIVLYDQTIFAGSRGSGAVQLNRQDVAARSRAVQC